MDSFPSNSHQSRTQPAEKAPEKVILRVVEGDVVRRKRPLGTRIREMFLGDDTKGVAEYVITDVLVPAWKDMVADAVSQGIERMIFGETRPPGRRGGTRSSTFNNNTGHVNYSRYGSNSNRREDPRSTGPSRRARATHDFDEIIIPTRREAEEVIEQLDIILEKYESVSVKDLYELVGVDSHYTDEKWGWTELRGASVSRISNGYLLNLPKTEPLD
jgi:hypothetical protein